MKPERITPLQLAIVFLILLGLGMLVAFCAVIPNTAYAQEANVVRVGSNRATLHVTDWGRGMTPVLPPYRNDPEGVVLSQNFYSLQPGGRQLRFGYVELVDSASAAAVCGNSGVDAISVYEPAVGERKLMYAIGGKWAYSNLDTTVAELSTSRLLPYLSGPAASVDRLNWAGDSAWYSAPGARFLQHLQVGDTLSMGYPAPNTFARKVRWVIDDNKVRFTDTVPSPDSGVYTVRRWYHNDSAIQPFYYQYGDELFTGTKRDRPQVVYPGTVNQYFIRPMGIADSVKVDKIYFKFGDTSTIVQSTDTTSSGQLFISMIQVVDRGRTWLPNVWGEGGNGGAETFYFRFGSRISDSIRATTFRILGNTDTSLFLAALFIDSITNFSKADTSARILADTVDFLAAVGGLGYIFSAAGNYKTVHTGVDSLRIDAGGAVLVTGDSLHLDSLYGVGGLYFVRPLEKVSITFRAPMNWSYVTAFVPCGERPVTGECEVTDGPYLTYIHGFCEWAYGTRCPRNAPPGSPGSDRYGEINTFTFFPILDAHHESGSMFIRSALSFDPSAVRVAIARWEIVRVDLPMWSGATEFQNALYAWGDTASLGTINKSKPNVPGALGVHAWSGNDDVIVGDNPSKAVVTALGYDDQLIIGQRDGMLTTVDGINYSELTQNIGIVGRRSGFPYNKEVFWQSDDGVYMVKRRDLAGYSVQKISQALDPVFNKWSAIQHGASVVPFTVNRALVDQSIMTLNKRDNHGYLFFAEGTSTSNNRCVTFPLDRPGELDGYFTFGAGAAVSARFHDTLRLIFGNPTKPVIYAYDYNFSDNGVGITGEIQQSPFFFQDEGGWPIQTKLDRIKLLARTTSQSVDTVQLIMIGERVSDTFLISYSAGNVADSSSVMYSNKDNISVRWQYKLRVVGDAQGAIYQPHRLDVDFIPVWRDQ